MGTVDEALELLTGLPSGKRQPDGTFEEDSVNARVDGTLRRLMETAKELNVPLPATALAHTLFNAMIASGRGDLDHSAVINIIEDLAKVEARTSGE